MSKWTGFLIGLVLALTGVMTLVRPDGGPAAAGDPPGTPTPATVGAQAEQAPLESVTSMARVKETDVIAPVEQDEPIPEFRWPDSSDPAEQTEQAVEQEAVAAEPNAQAIAVVDSPVLAVATEPPAQATDAALATDSSMQWYSFWHPFTSELSANGFRDRLERLTGLDYRVVREDADTYHVAFGYRDAQSRERNLVAIEAATGLNLRGATF